MRLPPPQWVLTHAGTSKNYKVVTKKAPWFYYINTAAINMQIQAKQTCKYSFIYTSMHSLLPCLPLFWTHRLYWPKKKKKEVNLLKVFNNKSAPCLNWNRSNRKKKAVSMGWGATNKKKSTQWFFSRKSERMWRPQPDTIEVSSPPQHLIQECKRALDPTVGMQCHT